MTGRVDATRTSRLNVPGPGILATGQPADPSWRLTVGGTAATPVTLWGWEQGFEVPRAGRATLTRADGLTRPLVLAGVGLAWMIVIVGWALSRRTRDDETLVDGPVTEPADGSGSLVRLGGPATTSQAVEVTEVRVGDTDATDADSAASPGEDAP